MFQSHISGDLLACLIAKQPGYTRVILVNLNYKKNDFKYIPEHCFKTF